MASGGAGAASVEGASRRSSAGTVVDGDYVFVSYTWLPSGIDGEMLGQRKAHAIVKLLREAGYCCWVDVDHMAAEAAGGGIGDAMRNAIRRSAAVVICASETYSTRPNCRLEAEEAARGGRPVFWVK